MKEIAALLLEEFKDCGSNTIANYAANRSTISLPVNSKLYQDAEYWFGVKPLFYIRVSTEIPHDPTRPDTKVKGYPEDLELSSYLKREENLIAHRKFIEEVLQSISLIDFIQIRKNLMIRNPDIIIMQKELSTLHAAHKELEESSKNQIERLKMDVEMWKETADEKEFIADLKRDISYYKAYSSRIQKELDYTKRLCEEKDKEHEEHVADINQRRCSELTYAQEQHDALRKENTDLKKTMDKKVQKALEKEREAKQKIKDKKALEKVKAEKAAKKAKKLAEMSDSDDSGSDSD